MPASSHFLGRIRASLTPRQSKLRPVKLSKEAIKDLGLWRKLVTAANRGMSINLLVTGEPNRICWSDACPCSLRGYSLSGRAWRIQILAGNPLIGHSGVNNLLEFTAMVINIWLECIDSPTDQDCILTVGDSTSAIGWLFKSSGFILTSSEYDAHLMVARHLATLLIKHGKCLASQHLRGELNVVADLLSFARTNERGKPHPLASFRQSTKQCTHPPFPTTPNIAGARERSNLSASNRETLLGHSTSAANRHIVFGSCQEGQNEASDRVWRRWEGFVRRTGNQSDPFLTMLSVLERELFTQAFLQRYRTSSWTTTGNVAGVRPIPLVSGTVRQAASHVAATFRINLRESPMHRKESAHLQPFVRALLKAYNNEDPPKRQQQAMTPSLLRGMYRLSRAALDITQDSAFAIVTELSIVAFFFAMGSCEISFTPLPGRTKTVKLSGVSFRGKDNQKIITRHPTYSKWPTTLWIRLCSSDDGPRMRSSCTSVPK
jgi:hypothetical protein